MTEQERPRWYERRITRRTADAMAGGGAISDAVSIEISPVGRILVAVIATWVALVAIPGALPWSTGDEAGRAIAIGAGITSLVALICAAATWLDPGQAGREAGWIGLWAALFGLGLAALQVVNVLLIPEGAIQGAALGGGLLILLAFAFLLAWKRRAMLGEGTPKVSTLPLLGSIVAVALIAAFLILTSELFGRVEGATAEEWIRYADLRGSLEALAFAAAGALLGTTIQKQATDREANRADDNGEAAAANLAIATTAFDTLQAVNTTVRTMGADGDLERRQSALIESVLPMRDHLRLPR